MKKHLLLIRKLRAEIGLNAFRIVTGAVKVAINTIRPVERERAARLELDRRYLLAHEPDSTALLRTARFYRRVDEGPVLPIFREIIASDRADRWRWTTSRLAYLATLEWPDVSNPADHLSFLQNKPDSYFRYHDLNGGRNDLWEYYLVPWHRTYGRLAMAMLDERLRPVLHPIWSRYHHWYSTERPWMTRLIVGSNVSSVLAGYTFHSMMGFLLAQDASQRRECVDRYAGYAVRLQRALRGSYDRDSRVAVPFEGVLYGCFWLRTAVVLGLVQRALGLKHCLLDEPVCRTLSEYVWQSRTPDGDYQTSGDSRSLREGAVPEDILFPVLAAAGNDPFAEKLADSMSEPYFLRDRIDLPA